MRFLFTLFLLLPAFTSQALELVFVEKAGCVYCEKWNADVSETYPKTDLGQQAPLQRMSKEDAMERFELERGLVYTPTFLFIENGVEVARMEGYISEDFFWAWGESIASEFDPAKDE